MSEALIVTSLDFEICNPFAARAAAAALREAGYDATVRVGSSVETNDVVHVSDVPSGLEAAAFDIVGTHAPDARPLNC